MRLSVERLRWVLVTGAVLLLIALVGAVEYGRYRTGQIWKKAISKVPPFTLTHDSNGVTYSQSDGKRTIFTLHAARAIPEKDGKYALKHAELTLYGKVAGEDEKIFGEDFEYDQKEGVARALGEVTLELHTPASPKRVAEMAANGGKMPAGKPGANVDTSPDGSQTIHVKTSGVRYLRSLGVAATDEKVEFRWGGLTCDAKGAEFDPDESTLHLLSDVYLTGEMQGHPVTMTATEAHLDRSTNVADLVRAVVRSEGKSAEADHVLAYFRADGSMERAQAIGSVVLRSGTAAVTATRMDVTLNEVSRPVTMKLLGGVALADSNPTRPVHASAETVDARFDAKGMPKTAVATGAVSAFTREKNGSGPDLNRELHGDRVEGTFVPVGTKRGVRLSVLEATGNARAKGESLDKTKTGPVVKTVSVAGDDLRSLFGEGATGQPELQHLSGTGHTMLEQETPLGEMERSTGDTLEMMFGAAGAQSAGMEGVHVVSAVQTGHVDMHTRAAAKEGSSAKPEETTAGGDRAVYSGVAETLTLSGAARFSNGVDSLTALTVTMDQRSGDAVARGKVVAAIGSAEAAATAGTGGAAASAEQPATHVLSAEAKFTKVGKLAEFRGTDKEPAKMWQGASQLQAAVLLFDGVKRTMSARPLGAEAVIHAVFAGEGSGKPAGGGRGVAAKVVRVASQRMDYADVQREATFAGMVKMEGATGKVEADRAVVMLNEAKGSKGAKTAGTSPLGGSIDKVVAYGNVRMEQPGRHGTGDQLTYTAATDSFVLTGTPGRPPHVVDDEQGDVTGATLLFEGAAKGADSTIIVSGEPPGAVVKGGRVRTETDVRR